MRFRALLARSDGFSTGAFVQVPFDVEAAFGKKRPPVVVTVGSVTYRSTVAVYGGKSFLPLREELRREAGVEVGAEVEVRVELDLKRRVVALPKDLKAALAGSARAKAAWASMAPSHQREQVQWLTAAKLEATRERRLVKWLAALEAMPPKAKPRAPRAAKAARKPAPKPKAGRG